MAVSGLVVLKQKNTGLFGKWKWHFINEQGALWRKVIVKIHGSSGGFDFMVGSRKRSTWSNIVSSCNRIEQLDVPLNNLMVRKIYRGTQIYFWMDNWQPSGLTDGDLAKLVTDLRGLTLDEAQDDKWEWTLTSSGKFSVTSLCRAIHLRVNTNDVSAPPFDSNSWVPRKVNVCA
ncbi:hypothetical protein Tco_1358616 [Tanacetum coccineum]